MPFSFLMGYYGSKGKCSIKFIDNIASQRWLLALHLCYPTLKIHYYFFYISGTQGAAVSMFVLLQVCAAVGGFSIRNCPSPPLWGVGKPVVNPAGWFRFPASADSPPQRIFFLLLFLLEVPIWLHESRQINNCIN